MIPTDPIRPDPDERVEDMLGVRVEAFYTYQDVATLWGVKVNTVYGWVRRGQIPSPIYCGGAARFDTAAWLAICAGPGLPGMFERASSPRAEAAAKAKQPAKKPTAKKSTAKKRGTK